MAGFGRATRIPVHARLGRLSGAGIVAGYSARVRLLEVGILVEAFVDVELAQGALQAVIDALGKMANVLEVHVTTGRADLMVRIAAGTHEELQHLIQAMYDIDGVKGSARQAEHTIPDDFKKTDLPVPDGPSRTLTSRSGTSIVTSSQIRWDPKDWVSPSTEIPIPMRNSFLSECADDIARHRT